MHIYHQYVSKHEEVTKCIAANHAEVSKYMTAYINSCSTDTKLAHCPLLGSDTPSQSSKKKQREKNVLTHLQ